LLMESGAGIVLFIAGTGWSVQRYETDFLPLFALAALVAAFARLPGWLTGLLLVPGMIVSLAFGFNGPYDEMLRNKPARYVRIAGWFSPVARQKPLLNPSIEHSFTRPAVQPEGTRDVLIDAGPSGARYELRLEQLAGKPILISQFFHAPQNGVKNELPPVNAARQLRAEFDPATLTMTVTQNGAVVLVHKLGPLVTAPSEIYYGPSTL
ncbi:MAG: hypothetical protein JWN34_4168, partial [Bryobacterales bacterium]|nr:hypothetical protein [Bryobacterales bacterium]